MEKALSLASFRASLSSGDQWSPNAVQSYKHRSRNALRLSPRERAFLCCDLPTGPRRDGPERRTDKVTSDHRKSKSAAHLSSDTLKRLTVEPTTEVVWDETISGFGLRVRGKSDQTAWRWIYTYRHKTRGTQVTLTLGGLLLHTPEEARRWAKETAKKANTSDDPFDAKEAARAAHAAEQQQPTVSQLWDEWYAAEGKAKKSAKHDEQRWRIHIKPRLGKLKVAEVAPRDINRLKTEMAEQPVTANRCISLVSVMFTYAVTHQYRRGCAPEHPIKAGAVKRNEETPIDFFYSIEQLGRILEAADAEPNKAMGLAIRMLAVTGARLAEVTTAHWAQFEEREDGRLVWTVERSNTKTKKPYQRTLDADLSRRLLEWRPTSLADQAASQLRNGGRAARQLVFPNSRCDLKQRKPIRLVEAWERVRTAAGITQRIHDLRHTVATAIVKETGSLEAAKRQLGHTTIVTTQRYAHHVSEMAEQTSNLLAQHVEAAVAKARASTEEKVVRIQDGAA